MRVAFRVVLVKYTGAVNCEVSKEMDALVSNEMQPVLQSTGEMQSQPASSAERECALWFSDLNIAQKRVRTYVYAWNYARQATTHPKFYANGDMWRARFQGAVRKTARELLRLFFLTAREQWRSNF